MRKAGVTKEKIWNLFKKILLNNEILLRKIYKNIPMFFISKIPSEKTWSFISANIDWSNSIACAEPDFPGIYVLKDNEVYKRIISNRLKELRDPYTGEKLKVKIWFREEIYHGKYLEYLPDILFYIHRCKISGKGGTGKIINTETIWQYDHSFYASFIAYGKNIKTGHRIKGTIYDVSPTILRIFNIDYRKYNMDGKILDIFC